jgi:hypothetical protein
MRKASLFFGIALLALAAGPAFGSSVCPAPNGGDSNGEGVSSTYLSDTTTSGGVVTGNTGCNVLITFGSGGSITTTTPNAAPSYDSGGDDNLIGIVNNSGAPITSLALNGGLDDVFGFDGDGICGASLGGTSPGYTFVGGGNPCGAVDSSGYGDNGITFSNINAFDTTGDVNFPGGIPNGGTAFFSLEGPVNLNLTVTPVSTPEPGTLLLLGTGLLGLVAFKSRFALTM